MIRGSWCPSLGAEHGLHAAGLVAQTGELRGGGGLQPALCSHGSAYAHYPCFITFSCHFFYPKKYFLKVKKKKRHIKHANT